MAAQSAKRHEAFGQKLAATALEAEGRIAKAKEEALAQVASVAIEVATAAATKLAGTSPAAAQVEDAVRQALGGRG